MIDHMLEVVHWFMAVLFVGWTLFFLYVLFRFQWRKNPKASHEGITSHFSTHLEVGVVIVEVVLLLGFAFPLWANRVDSFPTGPDVAKVRAVGEQFRWTFHYTGPDGKFGRVDPDLISLDNLVGLDREDPNAKDDFLTINKLTLPVHRKAIVQVTSKDVIHGLAPVKLRIQQDAIPGMEIPMWFTPNKITDGDIICAQLCGIGHAQMYASFEIIDGAEYDKWVVQQSPVKEEAPPLASAGQ